MLYRVNNRAISAAWPPAALVLLVAAIASVAGCTCTRRGLDTSLKYVEAKAAYEQSCPPCLPHAFQRHFERGWRCGYLSVAKGRRACPPAVPPHQYWTHKYQSAEGRQFIVTWYDGWRAGAATAKSFGVDNCYRVPAICSDCDCRTACLAPATGVLPLPEAVTNGGFGRAAAPPVPAPIVRLPAVVEPAGVSAPGPSPSDDAEVLAPPPASP